MTRMTIRIDPDTQVPPNYHITVAENGKHGGHVRERHGRRLVWVCDPATVTRFTLAFERLDDVEGALGTRKDWPFESVRAWPTSAKVDELDCEVRDADKVVTRLGNDPGVFKYTVKVVPADGIPPVHALDPVIIVGR